MQPLVSILLKLNQNKKETSFSRNTLIDEAEGLIHTDCSGVFNYLLSQYRSSFYQQLLDEFSSSKIKAFQFFDYFKSRNNIKNINKIKIGMAFIWRKNELPKSGDTGHMGFVLSKPLEVSPFKYAIEVLDVSKMPHDDDERVSGLGRGVMYLITNEEYEVGGYIWSSERKKNKRTEILFVEIE